MQELEKLGLEARNLLRALEGDATSTEETLVCPGPFIYIFIIIFIYFILTQGSES